VKHIARGAVAGLLAASLSLAVPLAAFAQDAHAVTLEWALAHSARETRALAQTRNQISVTDIALVPVPGAPAGLARGARRAGLQAALAKATVANTDRSNGASEDQQSLAEYLQQVGIDPNNVIAVDVSPRPDPQNPRVTVFYRGQRAR
jgi:hypothetical protein